MKRYWKVGLTVALLVSLVLVAFSKETPPLFIEMEVKAVRVDAFGHNPVVLLADKEGNKALPIWIGLLEATAIDKELKKMTSPRPMTHDLLKNIIDRLGAELLRVEVNDLRDNTFYSTIFLKKGRGKREIAVDARPSDAIALAATCGGRVRDDIGMGGHCRWGRRRMGLGVLGDGQGEGTELPPEPVRCGTGRHGRGQSRRSARIAGAQVKGGRGVTGRSSLAIVVDARGDRN